MGFILDDEKAAIWRGPMLSGAIKQLMDSTIWGDLDILFVDMPPGTGDAYLTVSSEIKPDHAILITTPNKLAIHDTLKSLSTFSKLKTNVLGFIENNLFQTNVKQSYPDLISNDIKFMGSLSFDNSIHNFDFFRSNEEINHITTYLLELLNESN
jgi:ATP-binding protein involved in chromosome partitioning